MRLRELAARSPRAAATERGFRSVTNPDFPSPLSAERVGKTGERVSGRFLTLRVELEGRTGRQRDLDVMMGRAPSHLHISGT